MHSLSSVVWCGVAWRTVALHGISVRVISIAVGGGGLPAALVAWACISPSGAFPGCLQAVLAVSGSFALLGVCLRMSSWLLLGSAFGGGFGVLSSISPPSSPYSGE